MSCQALQIIPEDDKPGTLSELEAFVNRHLQYRRDESQVITQDIINDFADRYGDRNPIHLDRAAARDAGFPDCVAHGQLVGVFSTGMASKIGVTDRLYVILKREKIDYETPVIVGDEIHINVYFTGYKQFADGVALVTFVLQTMNHRGTVVREATTTLVIKEKPHATSG